MPRVSALTPTYNRADYVEGAIRTVLGQTHDDVEAVVVDDASTDDTRAVLERYADHDRVTVRHNDENRGIGYSFNRAAEAATGDYYCILGDDDRWHPQKVERQLEAFERLPDDYGVVYTWGVFTDGDRITRSYESTMSGDVYPEILLGLGMKPHSSHMLRRECFESVDGFDPSIPRGTDWEMTIRLAREWRFEYVPERLTARLFHDSNVSSDLSRSPPLRYVWDRYSEEIEAHPDIERQFMATWHRYRALQSLRSDGEYATPARHATAAFALDPSASSAGLAGVSLLGTTGDVVARRIRRRLTDLLDDGDDTSATEWAQTIPPLPDGVVPHQNGEATTDGERSRRNGETTTPPSDS